MADLDADLRATIVDAFRRFDRGGAGVISRAKLAGVLASLGPGYLKEGDIDAVLAATGGDGSQIPYEDLADWITCPRKGTPSGLSRCSTGIDSAEKLQVREELQQQDLEARLGLEAYCATLRHELRAAVPSACPKGHALERLVTDLGPLFCHICRRCQAVGVLMVGCRLCNYNLCAPCTQLAEADRLEHAVLGALAWLEAHPLADCEDLEAKKLELEGVADKTLAPLARPLTAYFKRGYCEGEFYEGPRYRKVADEALEVQLLEHNPTGIRVWAEALDLRAFAPSEAFVVLYLYTGEAGLRRITREDAACVTALAGGQEGRLDFGTGIYASCKEPQAFGSKEAVLLNNLWPRVGDTNIHDQRHATHLLARGNPNAGPEDPQNRPVCEAILRDEARRRLADYCVPMLVPERFAFNIWERTPPELCGWCLGCNRWGEKQWAERDVWVVLTTALPVTLNTSRGKAEIGRKRAAWLSQTKGPNHADTLACVSELAWLLKGLGEYAEAEALFRRELRATEDLLGPIHPDTLTSVDNLAGLLKAMGVFDEAETLYRRALEGSKRKLGPTHPDTLTSVNNLAGLLMATGDLEEAESLYRQALTGSEETLGPVHPDTLTSMSNLAGLMKARGQATEAEELYRLTLKGRQKVLGASHRHTLRSLNSLAAIVEEMGGEIEAEQLLVRGYADSLDAFGPVHPEVQFHLAALADFLERRSRPEEAETLRARLAGGAGGGGGAAGDRGG